MSLIQAILVQHEDNYTSIRRGYGKNSSVDEPDVTHIIKEKFHDIETLETTHDLYGTVYEERKPDVTQVRNKEMGLEACKINTRLTKLAIRKK